MSRSSRLRIDPSTHLPSIHSFGELSQFLRASIADEESRQFSESMGQVATHIEAIVAGLRLSRQRDSVAPMMVDLLDVLRAHRQLVVGLGLHWRELYEYAAYLQVLNNFRVLVGQWLLQGGHHARELPLNAADFELVAWRALGEGMLLLDMYEQLIAGDRQGQAPGLGALSEPQVERAMGWWRKLRL
jgi:hypothetical protein